MKSIIQIIFVSLLIVTTISAQTIDQQFFDDTETFLAKEVNNGAVKYTGLKNNAQLANLIRIVETADLSGADDATKKAFYINAYNLHVINAAAQAYPIESVQSITGFFDGKKVSVAGEQSTLNNLEKTRLLQPYKDARLHFVLVCGALGCPPITNFAYRPALLDEQLDQQTKLAMNDANFLKVNDGKAELSQIFKWYTKDFGGNKGAVLDFINEYKTTPVPKSAKISYYPYDWTLNEASASTSRTSQGNSTTTGGTTTGGNNAARYIVSSTIPKGSSEIKIFNNLYSQKTGSADNLTDRSTFFTTTISYLYGLNRNLNIGFNTRYRRVRNDQLPSSLFSVLGSSEAVSTRQGITAFGPQIRYAPVEKWTNFSIQSSFVFAIGDELKGSATQPFIDWNGATWNTQFFNDFPIGTNFSLFTEIDVLIEDIGSSADGFINRLSTPATLILSYNPNPKTTLYTIGGFSPFWESTFDYFYQYGVGAKYQFTPNFELELLVTDFTNKFLSDTGGQAATFNLGIRYNIPGQGGKARKNKMPRYN